MKIGVSSYSFHQAIKAGTMTVPDCVAKAHDMGFEGIEFIDLPGETQEDRLALAREIRAQAEHWNMAIIAYTVGGNLFQPTSEEQDAEVARLCRQVDVAKALGAPLMRHDVCYRLGKSGAARSFDGMLPTIADGARRVTEYAQALGIRTCTENHGYIAQDSDRVERLFNAVAHDNYGLLVDMGNFICVDENPITAVSRVAPYAIHVHAKDMRIRTQPSEGCRSMTRGAYYFGGTVIGEGDVPVQQCLAVLKRAGYDGFVSIEYEGTEDCFAGIARGLANLRSYLT